MYIFNKTSEYIDKMPKEEFENNYRNYNSTKWKRLVRQSNVKIKKQEEKTPKQLATQRENEFKRRENLASTVIDASLWQNRETVVNKMEQCTRESERQETCRYKPKPHSELQEHLYKFINAAMSVEEGQSVEKINTGDGRLTKTTALLVGKIVIHTMLEDNERVPYLGRVISQVPGFPTWFNITYDDGNYESVYSYELVNDYHDGDLEIVVDGDLETVVS